MIKFQTDDGDILDMRVIGRDSNCLPVKWRWLYEFAREIGRNEMAYDLKLTITWPTENTMGYTLPKFYARIGNSKTYMLNTTAAVSL